MKILVLNVGSSSVKYALYENKIQLTQGLEAHIGLPKYCKDHETAIKKILNFLKTKKFIKSFSDIKAVGHRVVHGGKITSSKIITSAVKAQIKKMIPVAPLHNAPELKGIEITEKLLNCKEVAVFDTSFHTSLPEKAYTYAIPKQLTDKYNIRRYGFHGISYEYLYNEACKTLKKKIPKLVICHLGNGSSITAVKNGQSVDTSMGFTPTEGLVMGSRSGDLDPSIIAFLSRKGMSCEKLDKILNFESGLKGLSGERNFIKVQDQKNKLTKLAFDVYAYRLTKYIGAYAAVLNGVDAIVFSGGIGEHSWKLRQAVAKNLTHLGVKIDNKKNKSNARTISTGKTKVLVIPTDEQSIIVRDVLRLVR